MSYTSGNMINKQLVPTHVKHQISPLYSMYFSYVHIFVADGDINLNFAKICKVLKHLRKAHWKKLFYIKVNNVHAYSLII